MAEQNNESAVKTMVFPVVVLVAICLVCSAILAGLNAVTAPVIEMNELHATMDSYLAVLPEGVSVETMTDHEVSTEGVLGAVSTADGMVAVKAAAPGYSGKDVTIYVCFDQSGAISALSVDASTQSPGIGTKAGEEAFTSKFLGHSGAVSAGTPVDAIGGATYSSNAVFTAVNAAVTCYQNELQGVA